MKQFHTLLLLSLTMLASCQGGKKAEVQDAPQIPPEWAVLEKDGYRIRYPHHWELQHCNGTEFCLLSRLTSDGDMFRDNVNLVVENLLEGISIDKYVSLSLKNFTGKYSSINKKKYVRGGQEYYHVTLYGTDGTIQNQNYLLKGKKVYVLTFTYEQKEASSIKAEGENIMLSFGLQGD